MRGALAPITIDALRHLSVHGVTSLTAIKAAIAGLETKTMNNLVQLGHALRTETGLCITPKGREKLQWADNPDRPATTRSAKPEAATAPQLSNHELDAAILAALGEAGRGLPLATLAHRLGQPLNVVRPAVTMLSQRGRVHSSASKPPRYSLPGAVVADTPAQRHQHGSNRRNNGYLCPELQRNPGIGAERFVAFVLPSRVGSRLHWPDGRVTSINDPREVVA